MSLIGRSLPDDDRQHATLNVLSWHCGQTSRSLERIGLPWDCRCGRSGPHAYAEFTVPNDVFRTYSHFQVSFNKKKQADRALIESADGLLSLVDTSAVSA
jgi:hypothetical protein